MSLRANHRRNERHAIKRKLLRVRNWTNDEPRNKWWRDINRAGRGEELWGHWPFKMLGRLADADNKRLANRIHRRRLERMLMRHGDSFKSKKSTSQFCRGRYGVPHQYGWAFTHGLGGSLGWTWIICAVCRKKNRRGRRNWCMGHGGMRGPCICGLHLRGDGAD